jgi:hypothetical protein
VDTRNILTPNVRELLWDHNLFFFSGVDSDAGLIRCAGVL